MARGGFFLAAAWLCASLPCAASAAAAHQCRHAVVVSGSPEQLAWAASACLEATEINVAALNSRHELELLRSAELFFIGDRAKTLPVAFLANRETSTWLLAPPLALHWSQTPLQPLRGPRMPRPQPRCLLLHRR